MGWERSREDAVPAQAGEHSVGVEKGAVLSTLHTVLSSRHRELCQLGLA